MAGWFMCLKEWLSEKKYEMSSMSLMEAENLTGKQKAL